MPSLTSKHDVGRTVILLSTTDEYTDLKAGAKGTIDHIDDLGTVFVQWEDGSVLGLIPGEDSWMVVN